MTRPVRLVDLPPAGRRIVQALIEAERQAKVQKAPQAEARRADATAPAA